MSEEKDAALKKAVYELWAAGVLETSESEWSSPAFVKKINGSWKLCVDYKELNKRMISDNYYMPTKKEILESVKESGLYTKIAILDAYHQIKLDENSKHLTAFKTSIKRQLNHYQSF